MIENCASTGTLARVQFSARVRNSVALPIIMATTMIFLMLMQVPCPCQALIISPNTLSLINQQSRIASSSRLCSTAAAPAAAGGIPFMKGTGGGIATQQGRAAPMGEADLAFQTGVMLEKCGEARAAQASFHEAATLYKCFLEQQRKLPNKINEFSYVTSIDDETIHSILAYTCIRLAHLNHDYVGDSPAAARLYKEATLIDPLPSSVAYDGWGTAMEASSRGKEDRDLRSAIQAYRKAIEVSPSSSKVKFHLAVALERLAAVSGQDDEKEALEEEANDILEQLRRGEAHDSCLVDSWGYVRWHTRKVKPQTANNLYRGTRRMLEIALEAAMELVMDKQEPGLVCEFGVASGRSLRMTQEILPLKTSIYGFDTFEGLPQAWGNEPAGTYSTGGVTPQIEGAGEDVTFVKGLFKDTLKEFLKLPEHKDKPLAYANIDCDLYSSTYDILEGLHGRIVPGSILVFDKYLGHPTWRQDEFRAWRECCKRFGWRYEYLAFSLSSKQAVVRVIDA